MIPENASVFYAVLIELVNFDPLPYMEELYLFLFNIEKGEPFSTRAERFGYESRKTLYISGSLFVLNVLTIVF